MLKKYIKIFLLNIIIFVFCVEILSFILTKINILPNGLPPSITLNAHEKFSYWHPKNSEFKIATKCWESKVKFNNIGIKSNNDITFSIDIVNNLRRIIKKNTIITISCGMGRLLSNELSKKWEIRVNKNLDNAKKLGKNRLNWGQTGQPLMVCKMLHVVVVPHVLRKDKPMRLRVVIGDIINIYIHTQSTDKKSNIWH